MFRKTSYRLTGSSYSEELEKQLITAMEVEPTPDRGIYDHAICDSGSTPEHNYARQADRDFEVVCFRKLPAFYKIPTPIGNYTPDFGLVVQRKGLKGKAVLSITVLPSFPVGAILIGGLCQLVTTAFLNWY